MTAIAAEMNTKIPAEPKTKKLHSDGFDIRFDYDSFSNKTIVTMSHRVLIKLEGRDLAICDWDSKRMRLSMALTHCISVYGEYGMIYSVKCLHSSHSESVSG